MNYAPALLLLLVCSSVPLDDDSAFDPSSVDALPAAMLKVVEEAYRANMDGLEALERGDFSTALARFDKALETVPFYTDALNNKGVVYFRRGIVSEARGIWEKISEQEPRYQIALYNLGVLAYQERNHDEARQFFERVLRINRRQAAALVMLGRLELENDALRRGLAHLERAFRFHPDDLDVWRTYAWGLLQAADTAAAELVLRGYPGDTEALRMLGGLAATRGDFEAATRYLGKAADQGGSAEVLYNLAASQQEQGKHKEVLATLERYFQVVGGNASAEAYLLAGISARTLGDVTESIRILEEGIRRHRGDVLLRHNLGQVHFFNRAYRQAREIWDEAGVDTLADPNLMYLRALAALNTGDTTRGTTLIQRALQLDERPEHHDLYGVLAYRRGDSLAAHTAFRAALERNPRHRSAQLNLAMLTREPGELKAAVQDLEREHRECTQDCGDVTFRLSVTWYHMGEHDRALAVLESLPPGERDERMYRHMGIYLRAAGEYTRAIEVLEAARARFVVEPQTEYELAGVCMLAGRYSQAAAILTLLVQRWEGNPWRLYYQLGYAFMENNELEKARGSFERSLEHKRDNPASRGMLAFVHNRMGDAATARQLWERTIRDDPDNPTLWINMGLSYEAREEYGKALDAYRRAQQLEPHNKAISINLGNAFAALDRNADAMHAYQQALESPHRETALQNMLLLSVKQRHHERARELLDSVRKEFPGTNGTLRGEGEVALLENDTARALRLFEAITEPLDADWYQMARLYALAADAERAAAALKNLPREGIWKGARADIEARLAYARGECDTALRIWGGIPDTSFAFEYNLAMALYQCQRYREVIERGTRLVTRASGRDRADVCRLVGNAAFELREWERARQWYEQLSLVEQRSAVVQYNLAVAHYNLDNIERAWTHYQRAREQDSSLTNKDIEKRYAALHDTAHTAGTTQLDTLDELYNRAVVFQQQEMPDSAEALYRVILSRDSTYVRAWNNLGTLYAARAEVDSAKACYQRALDRRFDLVEAYANLIHLYLATGDATQARRWIIKGRGHNPDSELLEQLDEVVADSLRQQQEQE